MFLSKSVPGGCVLGLFGIGALVYGVVALAGAWMITKKESPSDQLGFLLITGIAGVLIGIGIIVVGVKLAMRVPRDYDPFDPDEPRMKF